MTNLKLIENSNRINRKSYLLSYIFSLLIPLVFYIFDVILYAFLGKDVAIAEYGLPFTILGFIIYIVYSILIRIKRFHDLNRSGRDILFFFVPFINLYFAFLLFFSKGSDCDNDYGTIPSSGNIFGVQILK